MIRPPVVQIYIGNNTENPTVRNVLTYPLKMSKDLKESAKSLNNETATTYFEHSLSFNETSANNEDKESKKGYFNVKRYIVTSVSIKDLENTNGWNYNVNKDIPGTKRGFIVTLSLSETTRNFLDLVPDFKAYYDASKIDDPGKLLSYNDKKFFYSSRDTNELLNGLQDYQDKTKQIKKDTEKDLKQYKKNLKEKQQSIEIMEEDKKFMKIYEDNKGSAYNSVDDYGKYTELSKKYGGDSKKLAKYISKEKVAAFGIEADIGHLKRSIGNFNADIRNISSAMKTLTLGAY